MKDALAALKATKLQSHAATCSGKISMLLILLLTMLQLARAESGEKIVTLAGVLLIENGSPILKSDGKLYRLSSPSESIAATIQDKRLANRRVRLEGKLKEGGGFEVHQLYTIRDGNPYRVIYFCEVCNITRFRPGDCDCCQAPYEIREVPPTDPRVAVK